MMKCIIACYLLFAANSFLVAQQNRDDILKRLNNRPGIKVTEIEKDILRLEYPDGNSTYYNIGEYVPKAENSIIYSPTFDSTVIDLTNLDTSLYYHRYSFWQEVKVGSPYTAPPLISDINNNGLPEIYGMIKDYSSYGSDVVTMEMNMEGIFDSVFKYDSTNNPRAIYDINKDGLKEAPFRRYPSDSLYTGHSWVFFTQPSDTSLATDLSFIFYPFPENNQLNNNTFGDWDGDELTDQIFGRHCCPNSIYIYEYNPLANNFDSIYYYDPSQYSLFWSGFAIGDINQNGKTEFFSGSLNGNVIAIENCGDNCYGKIWNGTVETKNAYLYAATNDIDGNGKPEVWIGGHHFQDGVGITRVTIFEASGNNNYIAVGKVDIIGAFNWYAQNMQVLDVDKDGKEEVMLCIEQHVVILKFNGTQNHHTYDVFYIKRNDLAYNGRNSVFYGAAMYDVTGDGKEDLVIHLDDIITNVGMRLFTFIYKADFSVDVNEPKALPEKFHLHQNYPNPFNPSTTIKFEVPEYTEVSIKAYDILGKEITTIMKQEFSPGNYNISWEAKDSNGRLLPTGIYLIRLSANGKAGSFIKIIKVMLLK